MSRQQRLLVINLLAHLAYGLLAMTICIPSMQEWGAVFGEPQSRVQLTFSGFVVAFGGLQLFYGPWSDRLGRKKVLLAGVTLALLGSAMGALASNLAVLILARVLQGAGAAAGAVVARAMVQDVFAGPQRTRVMAYIGMAMGLCPPLATILGGQLHVAWGWQANFVLMTVLACGLWLAAWRGLPNSPPTVHGRTHWLRAMFEAYRRLVHEPAFLLYVVIVSMTTATFYAFLTGAPMVLRSHGVGPNHVGYYIMTVPLSYFVGNYLTSRMAQQVGEARMMALGQCVTVAGVAAMLALALAGVNTALAFALPLTLLGLGHGLLVPPALTGTVSLVPALAGSAAAAAGLMQQLTGAFGGYAVGLLNHDTAINLGWLMLGLAGLGAWAQLLLRRLRKRQRKAS
jgi:MFS transporter, DHA1 family, multidrug resistance protein